MDLLQVLPYDRSILSRFADDPPELRRRARLVAAFSLLGFTGGTSLALSHWLFFEIPARQCVAPLVAGLTSLLVPPLLLRSRSLRLSGHVLSACWLLACGWGVYLRGGLASPPVMCQVAAPFIAFTLIDRPAALFWLVVVGAEYGVYLVLAALGITLPDLMAPRHHVTSNLVAATLFGTLVLAMALALEWLRLKAQEELAEAERGKLELMRETQLLRADRLASIGQLAGSIAHELNNPLSYVLLNLEHVSAALPPGELQQALEEAAEGAGRMRTIVQDLKTFVRADDEQLVPVELGQAVQSSLRLVQAELKNRITLRRELGAAPRVLAGETRLGQIIVNLVVNAAQAMPEGGSPEIVVAIDTASDGSARLRVSDNGVGIPPAILARVTEPFFTTKPVGVGTGLGLSVVANLVKRFGGTLSIESKEGAGTQVTITLPAAAG